MPKLDDYLTKQIYIDKNVVTYRSLSRQFGIHVNEAKNELARFHTKVADSETRSFATYLVSGELSPMSRVKAGNPTQTDDGMDVDSETGSAGVEEDAEEVPTVTMTLVGEHDLEQTKSRYARIFSTHVYCLSPSPISDADLICGPSNIVYNADAKDAPISSIALGRVVGPDVYVGKASKAPVASSSKVPEPAARKLTLKAKAEDSPSNQSVDKDKRAPIKAKVSGKLDWSKAKKSSDVDKSKEKQTKVKKEESESPSTRVKSEKTPPKVERDVSPQDDSKRGTKRKAAPPPMSDDEEQSKEEKRTPTPTKKEKEAIKLRKNRVVSDDEDDEENVPKPRQRGKSRVAAIQSVLESQEEASLRAMMDMDDSQVEKVTASRFSRKAEAQIPEDEDVVMASEPEEPPKSEPEQDEDMIDVDDTPKPKPRKKKEKKVVPVGRNGLKKKRIMKTRMFTDAKGFMVTEDYSEYESVDEEQTEEVTQKKTKGKKAVASKPKKEDDDERAPPKSKPARTNSIKAKGTGAKASAQGSLKDFFGKPKK